MKALLPRLPLYLFLLALALASLLGGTPTGYEYALAPWGGDAMGGIVRALVLVSALMAFTTGTPVATVPRWATAIARYGVYGAATWVGVSLLVHSRFFTTPVFLSAMIPEALNWIVFATAFALAARFAAENRENVRHMAIAMLVGGAACAVVGVLAFGTVPGAERFAHRESATFFSPNFAGGFAALLLPLAVALFLYADALIALVLSGAAVALVWGLLLITGSRASFALGLIGLAVALALALIQKIAVPWKRVGGAVALLAVFAFVFGAPMLGRVGGGGEGTTTTKSTTDSGDHSADFRKETWRGTIRMATNNKLFGTAPGTFPYLYPRYASVAWTGHAHSSYLQLAAESGTPALLALIVGVGGVFLAGLRRGKTEETANPLLVPALLGGVVAALGRNVFDSEWILPASGVAFFTSLGLIVGSAESARTVSPDAPPTFARIASAAFFAVTLVLTLLLRAGQAERDLLYVQGQSGSNIAAQAKEAAGRILPPDPQLYAMGNDFLEAAHLSPGGKRFYQLARDAERGGDFAKAVQSYKEAVAADPNNQQTYKALAEAQTKIGDKAGALFTYTDMVRIARSPAGKIRALPELVDTLPAFAYTALAEDAAGRGDKEEATRNFRDAFAIIENYSRTAPAYQLAEVATLGGNTEARRAEVRALLTDRIAPGLRALDPAAVSKEDEAAMLARLDAFATGK
ncbi:MAG: O-antigen ligase family protein [Armatimonadetes bacterium]|nr:O-antigen ligase family protein [Armatimonadota bacterium]